MFVGENAAVSLTLGESKFSRKFGPFDPLVRETRGSGAKELRKADAPSRTEGSMIPLYVGYGKK